MLSFLAVSKMLAGIGFFLLGMNYLEDALRRLAGRSFKVFLRKQSGNTFKAIAGGAIVTGVLQSSSVVNLMVLAFVGSGVITMQNALAIILGSNIGTTLDSWVVASLGFSFNIEIVSLPLAGAAGIAMALFAKDSRLYQWSKFSFGIAALFIGLDFMKLSFSEMIVQVDFSSWRNYSALVFVLLGFVITTIIQSSSATVALVLSALHVEAIGLYSATAIVLGSEAGTTIKLLLASFHGVPAKKQVALGNFLYNGGLIIVVLLALQPINALITEVLHFTNPLLSLVFFQSFINVLGVIIFIPFLKVFERFLQARFKDEVVGSRYLQLASSSEGDLALDAMDKEIKRFIWCTLDLHLHAFGLREKEPHPEAEAFHHKSFSEKYDYLKLLHGEIHTYYIAMNKDMLDQPERERAEQLISAVRNSMFSAKSIKDSFGDIDQLKNSSSPAKYLVYERTQLEVREFCEQVAGCLNRQKSPSVFEDVVKLYTRVQSGYQSQLDKLYQHEGNHQLAVVDISTLINFNREFFAAHKALAWAVKDYLLEKERADYFEELPGFIR